MKKYKMGGRMNTGTAKGNPKSLPLSADVEADLKALETLEQPDYDTGGPRRRYPAGKAKYYPEDRIDIPEKVLRDIGKHKKIGEPKKMAKGGSVSSASKRADGCAMKGKTRGKFV